MRPSARRENLTIIQALRGLAAIWVVLFHASEGGHIDSLKQLLPKNLFFAIFEAGHFGVAVFFALSGFVISYGLTGNRITASFFGRFIVKRSIRLDPTYWTSILIAICISTLSAAVKKDGIEFPDFSTIVAHIFYLQVILGKPEINTVFWTLTYEVQFYLFLVGLLTIKTTIFDAYSSKYASAIDIILYISAMLSATGVFDNVLPGVFLPLWGCFYAGVLANEARNSRMVMAGFFLLCVALGLRDAFSAISALTAIFIFGSVKVGWAKSGMNWRWVQFLGMISYSLYLIHNPVTGATGFVIKLIMGTGIVADAIKLAAILIASILAGYILWRVVEKRTHAFARSIPAQASNKIQ